MQQAIINPHNRALNNERKIRIGVQSLLFTAKMKYIPQNATHF